MAFKARGLKYIVLCPGSRSAPLALAAGFLAQNDQLSLITSIDERSAAFLALGISTASGTATAVITTSGSAVAHLLPAAIEADRSTQPILFLTADRPIRLKDCGSNQTVNQEDFLRSVCRCFINGPKDGLHALSSEAINKLAQKSWQHAHQVPGPVHINLPLEEPLNPSLLDQNEVFTNLIDEFKKNKKTLVGEVQIISNEVGSNSFPTLDISKQGLIIVGPWRGSSKKLNSFKDVLQNCQSVTGWPIFADPLSGISIDQPGLIGNWELLLSAGISISQKRSQILRLGPMPSSRTLQNWLGGIRTKQVLVTEGDSRKLDPLRLSAQWSDGFVDWWGRMMLQESYKSKDFKNHSKTAFLNDLIEKDQLVETWLDRHLPLAGSLNEISLARWLPRLIPDHFSIMLAASSPIRDWLSFSGKHSLNRRCFGFRGASGIDGTLSLGMGLSISIGPTVLITGDLALLHDSNGWLFSNPNRPPLVVLLIDNGGGGIFKQLGLQTESNNSFERLFTMPQVVDTLSLADSYGIPYRQVSCLEDLQASLDWSFSKTGPVLIRVCTDALFDADRRVEIRSLISNHLLLN